MSEVIEEFKRVLDSITGVFIDAREGFNLLQLKLVQDATNKDWDTPIHYGEKLKVTDRIIMHSTTIQDRIGRNSCDGDNCTFISNMSIVLIYSYWEDRYRAKFSKLLRLDSEKIESDIFGELRYLRNSIVHKKELPLKKLVGMFY